MLPGRIMGIAFRLKQYAKMALQHLLLPSAYAFHRLMCRKIEPDLVVFADAHHNELPFSMQPLYSAVKTMGYNIVLHLHDYSHAGSIAGLRYALSFMKLYARARYVFLCDNFLPAASCRKRRETTLVQLWHSCGLLKKMGYDTADDVPRYYWGNVYKNYDLVTVSAECCVPFLSSGMRQPKGVVQPLGVSRTDVYFDEAWLEQCRAEFYKSYPEARDKKILLWAPTFRGSAASPTTVGAQAIERLQEQLGCDWFVISKVHPHAENAFFHKGIGTGSNCAIPCERLLPVTDLLITDYSSVLFDYLLFEKPFVLYCADLDEYRAKRGFYIEYSSLTGYIVTDGARLKDTVAAAYAAYESGESRDAIRKSREYHDGACDGKSTERILRYINARNLNA